MARARPSYREFGALSFASLFQFGSSRLLLPRSVNPVCRSLLRPWAVLLTALIPIERVGQSKCPEGPMEEPKVG